MTNRDITGLLQRWQGGEQEALSELMPLVYAELHRLAERHLAGERRGHTLQPTALVNEAYLRMAGGGNAADYRDRRHFFALAARLMRRILVDHARVRKAKKRGGGKADLSLAGGTDTFDVAAWRPAVDDILALDEAMQRLEAMDPRQGRVLELRFFAGLSVEETADVLGVSVQTVMLDTRLAKAWLYEELKTP